jgi:outer membrane biosynthesis protein TonB
MQRKQLVPCSSCQRHFRTSERACPFCGVIPFSEQSTTSFAARSAWMILGVGMAVAGCNSNKAPEVVKPESNNTETPKPTETAKVDPPTPTPTPTVAATNNQPTTSATTANNDPVPSATPTATTTVTPKPFPTRPMVARYGIIPRRLYLRLFLL